MRVNSTNPSVPGLISSQTITVNKYYTGSDTFAIVVCGNDAANITHFYNSDTTTITYSIGNPFTASLGIYSVFVTNQFGCRDTALVTVRQDVNIWKGSVNSNWHTPANWSTGAVPSESTHVIVSAGTPNFCEINTADANAASVQIKGGMAAALRILNGHKLLIKAKCSSLPN